MTYKGKTVIRMIGKMQGGKGMVCLCFADGSLQRFKVYYQEWTEVDGSWVYEPISGSSADSIYVKTDEHYRRGRRAAS